MTDIKGSRKVPIFNIQNYCIHDGPGIRTTVFVKGCPLRCRWCANPESNLARPQLLTYANRCKGDARCVQACPEQAISMQMEGGKIIAETDRNKCIDCGNCVRICPAGAREIAGKMMGVDEVLTYIEEDKIFYQSSGGGMTISGGEVLVYPDFASALLEASHKAGIQTAVESCCFAERKAVEQVFCHVDYGLLDIKHMDSTIHKKITGVSNEQILDNIKYIYDHLNTQITIRIPVIPGYNDDVENISDTAAFVANTLGTDVPIHLLPYHNMGCAKNESLGEEEGLNLKPPSADEMEALKRLVERYGLKVQIGGS